MCQKQTRDANGFKQHLTSDSHMRQMKIFAEDPDRIVRLKSEEFEKNYLVRCGNEKTREEDIWVSEINGKINNRAGLINEPRILIIICMFDDCL